MGRSRLEAFSDGVIAIIITIMVLELKVPEGTSLDALRPLWGVFLSYALSFVFIGIYWNNHHHLVHTVSKVSASVLWANLHLLFWLSLVPFVTGWMGEHNFAAQPTALYGVVLLMSAIAFTILARAIVAVHGPHSVLQRATAGDWKPNVSLGLYAAAVVIAWWMPALAGLIYVLVAVIWLVPNRRIERALNAETR
jgi:uncharacterized membrane protein